MNVGAEPSLARNSTKFVVIFEVLLSRTVSFSVMTHQRCGGLQWKENYSVDVFLDGFK